MVVLMKVTEKWKSVKKRTKILVISGLVLLPICVGAVVVYLFVAKGKNNEQMPVMNQYENGMITASGTTATDTLTMQLEIDSLEAALYVEEVYVSSQDTVSEGTPLFKITEESLKEAQKELKQKALQTEVAYNEQKLSYEESLIEARKNADITLVEGKYADSDYENNVAKENSSYESLKSQASEAQALADEYYAAVHNNYYYTYYELDKLEEEYYPAFSYLMELYQEWNIAESGKNQSQSMGGAMGMPDGRGETAGYDSGNVSLYRDFDEVVSRQADALESTREKYEEDTNKASYSWEAAQADAQLLNAQVQESAAELEQKIVQLKAQRDVTKAEAELAESNYEAEKKQLEQQLSKAEDEYEAAKSDYENFSTLLGDGILYAQKSGEIMMLNAREGQSLDVSMPYLVFNDSSHVTVTVSVDQSYIADLSVGDSAMVMISNLGTSQGTITSINPVSQSTSRSAIYYSVEVTLSGDLEGITSNLTATVMFGGKNEEGNRKPENSAEEQEKKK